MLNELETVYWSLTNNILRISAIDSDLILDYLMITALFAKKMTCEPEEIKIHESFLSHNYQVFMRNYLIWESMKNVKADDYNLIEVNEEFKVLFGDDIGAN